ncbi:PDZ domain-containing protein [soil metagenome]
MSQRTLAGFLAAPLVLALLAVAALWPLPYTVYRPGPSLNVLSGGGSAASISVDGHKSYYDDGELRMTTVRVTGRDHNTSLGEALWSWVSSNDAVYPRDAVYPEGGQTVEQDREEGQVQMATSQETAIAVAMEELGYHVERPAIVSVSEDMPADGVLMAGDIVLSVNGAKTPTADDVVSAITAAAPGEEMTMVVERKSKNKTVLLVPQEDPEDHKARIGVGLGIDYDFPFDVSINIDDNIGGPSAGLIFSLAVYDTLTKGSLTGGESIAGTGEIYPDGSVGPIGGIQQKIAGASGDGARLFLVPTDNWADAQGGNRGDMRIAEVTTMSCAVDIIEKWTADQGADLVCEDAS